MVEAFREWRTDILYGDVPWEIRPPRQFEDASEHIRPEDVARAVLVFESLDEHADRLADFARMGAAEIYVHNVAPDRKAFLEAFGSKVLPHLEAA